MPSRHDREVTTVTIVRRVAGPLVVVLACTACGVGQDPLSPPAIGWANATPAVGQTPGPASTSPVPTSTPVAPPAPTSSTTQQAQSALPRGGREVFPRYRLVGYADVTEAATLGRLGTGALGRRGAEIERRAKAYAAGRRVLPVVDVIATVVQGNPGKDGQYGVRLTDSHIGAYHEAAREHRAVLLLNLQPGRSEFITEAKAFDKW